MQNERKQPGQSSAPGKEFFLPELCLPQALLVFVLVLIEPMQPDFDWVRLALISLFVQWIVLLSAALLCGLRPWLARLRAGVAGATGCLLVVAVTVLCTAVTNYCQLVGTMPGDGIIERYLRYSLIALIMSALMLRYFYLQSQWRKQQQAELRARIESLQARIRPHFLFNTLNSIASLVTSAPDK